MKYALMVQEPNGLGGPYHRMLWFTHVVCDTFIEACLEQYAWSINLGRYPGQGTRVVEYHSREWESLVL